MSAPETAPLTTEQRAKAARLLRTERPAKRVAS